MIAAPRPGATVNRSPDRRTRSEPRRWWLESLHLFGLWSLALAHPVYQLIAANPQFLAAHAAGRPEVIGLVVAMSLVLPTALAGLGLLALPLGPRIRSIVQSVLVGILVAAFIVQIAKRVAPNGGWVVLAASLLAAALFAAGYHRAAALRSFVTFLTVAAVVAPLAFLLNWRILGILAAPAEVDSIAVRVGKPLPVVVVVLDELPLVALLDQHAELDADLFPSFARLASRSHWFRNATTTASHTELAVPALHTGKLVNDSELLPATLENYPRNLFTLLGATHRLHVLETTTQLLPRSARGTGGGMTTLGRGRLLLLDVAAVGLHVVTPAPWNSRLPPLDVGWAGFWGDAGAPDDERRGRIAQVLGFMDRLEDEPRPPLVYLHPRFPHLSWEYLPSGRRYFGGHYVPGLGMNSVWEHDDWLTTQAYQRLVVQVQATDFMLGEVLDRLEELGWLEESVLVVLADHGSAFTPGSPRRDMTPEHRETALAEIMPIPLFVKLPGQSEGVVHDEAVEIIDVLPTLAEILDIEIPWQMDGRSLLAGAGGERPPRRFQLQQPYATLSFDRDRPSPLAALASERAGWFGRTATGERDLFRIGPHRDLVGRPVPEAAEREPSYSAAILEERLFEDVVTDAPQVPALLTGEIHFESGSPPREPLPIAVAMNGTIRATTRTYVKRRGGLGFIALMPEEALRPGSNAVEIFLIGDGEELRRIETTGLREALRQKYDRSGRVLLAAGAAAGWGEPRASQARVSRAESGGLALDATGDLPTLELPPFETAGFDAMVVALETETAVDLRARLFYATRDDPTARPLRFVPGRARKGRGVTYFEVRAPRLLGRLTLDLVRANPGPDGPAPPRVVIHSVEARGVE